MSNTAEVRIATDTGVTIVAPAYPAPCDYIQIVDSDNQEIAYWVIDEWAEEPAEVMGSIIGAICSGANSEVVAG